MILVVITFMCIKSVGRRRRWWWRRQRLCVLTLSGFSAFTSFALLEIDGICNLECIRGENGNSVRPIASPLSLSLYSLPCFLQVSTWLQLNSRSVLGCLPKHYDEDGFCCSVVFLGGGHMRLNLQFINPLTLAIYIYHLK